MYSLKVQQGRPTIQGWRHLFVASGAPRCFARGKNRLPVRRCGLEVAPSGPGPPSALQTFHQCPKGLAPGAAGIYRAPQPRASGSRSPSSPRARNGATSNARRRPHTGAARCVFFSGDARARAWRRPGGLLNRRGRRGGSCLRWREPLRSSRCVAPVATLSRGVCLHFFPFVESTSVLTVAPDASQSYIPTALNSSSPNSIKLPSCRTPSSSWTSPSEEPPPAA